MKEIKVKRYRTRPIIIGILILLASALFFSLFFYFPSVQQCGLCEDPTIISGKITWVNHLVFFSFMAVVMIILFKTPLFGGLREEERKALSKVYQGKGKLNRYQLAKLLRIEKKKAWRIVRKFINFGYVKLTKEGGILITEEGEMFIEK